MHGAVGLGDDDEQVYELQSVLYGHETSNFATYLAYLQLPFGLTSVFAVFEEFQQDVVALFHTRFVERIAQKFPHRFHLRVHDFAVGLYYVRRQHHQREEKPATAVFRARACRLCAALWCLSLVFSTPYRVDDRTDDKTGDGSQHTLCLGKSAKESYPLDKSHSCTYFACKYVGFSCYSQTNHPKSSFPRAVGSRIGVRFSLFCRRLRSRRHPQAPYTLPRRWRVSGYR